MRSPLACSSLLPAPAAAQWLSISLTRPAAPPPHTKEFGAAAVARRSAARTFEREDPQHRRIGGGAERALGRRADNAVGDGVHGRALGGDEVDGVDDLVLVFVVVCGTGVFVIGGCVPLRGGGSPQLSSTQLRVVVLRRQQSLPFE